MNDVCGYDIHWDTGLTLTAQESSYRTANAADGEGGQFAPGPKFKETSNSD